MTTHNNQTPPPTWQFTATSQKPERTRLVKRGTVDTTPDAPTVYYTTQVWQVIKYLVAKCDKEVGWLGLVKVLSTGDYLIHQIYIPEQTVSGAETDITPEVMAALALEIMGRNEDPSTMIYWGHSHVNMGIGPSGQDERQLAEYLEHCPVFIRGIYNKRGEAKVDVFDTEAGCVYQCVDHLPEHDVIPADLRAGLDKLIKSNVKERSYYQPGGHTPNTNYNRGGGGNDSPKYPSTRRYEQDPLTHELVLVSDSSNGSLSRDPNQHNDDFGWPENRFYGG